MLELRDIVRSFKIGPTELTVLKGVSITVAAGEMVSITGGSGSGKTTFMNIVGLLDTPTSGTYRIDGKNVLGARADELSALR